MIEAFRDNGLNALDHNAEINVSRLETILSSIYYQLNKRLPTTHQINVEQSIGLLLNFMVATYDRYDRSAEERQDVGDDVLKLKGDIWTQSLLSWKRFLPSRDGRRFPGWRTSSPDATI